MSKQPFFSVVIPLYNKEHYIENTIKSVLNQTFIDFEIIVVNDGSTDSSLEKAEAVLSNYKDHTIIIQENKGLSASRNMGISIAKGQIIALIDADDLWHENFLKSMHGLYINFPNASFYGSDYLEKYSAKNVVETKKNINHNLKNKEFIVSDFFSTNIFQSIICQSSIAFKKEIFKTIAFDETIDYSEDVDFYLKSFMKHELAYSYTPLVTILTDVPNQITKIGIKNKTFPNLDYYEKKHPDNPSLKKYLDFKRYMFAMQSKLNHDNVKFSYYTKNLNYTNLSLKQKILLKSPLLIVKLIKHVKKFFLKRNIRLTSFER
ncbi:glycosyltransferase family 2 protein [Flavivirga amylovorans]|uniref:Glycosyltransferase family 2 protein n=1 Tax=Flavivirga amylovorans TaxID=870486 RepID=A0ABT8X5X5_9FLAO|nr:glycosyltransferase family 2 protein [Flavivirga amylovorans]MDO5988960.1 glycosyltransferase family 2 protein [Flavivirga amylovorans]